MLLYRRAVEFMTRECDIFFTNPFTVTFTIYPYIELVCCLKHC